MQAHTHTHSESARFERKKLESDGLFMIGNNRHKKESNFRSQNVIYEP